MNKGRRNYVVQDTVTHNSHAAAYALMAYITAYLKVYHPKEFMAASLTHSVEDTKKLFRYLNECKRLGIDIKQPHINLSTSDFKITKSGLLYPFGAIKQVGTNAQLAILEARKDGRFKSLDNFMERVNGRVVNVGVVINLILAGAFRKFGSREEQPSLLSRHYGPGKVWPQMINSHQPPADQIQNFHRRQQTIRLP